MRPNGSLLLALISQNATAFVTYQYAMPPARVPSPPLTSASNPPALTDERGRVARAGHPRVVRSRPDLDGAKRRFDEYESTPGQTASTTATQPAEQNLPVSK